MRRRLVISTIAIVLVVLGALAVPVGTDRLQRSPSNSSRPDCRSSASPASPTADDSRPTSTPDVEPDYERRLGHSATADGVLIIDRRRRGRLTRCPEESSTRRGWPRDRGRRHSDRLVVSTDVDPLDEQFREPAQHPADPGRRRDPRRRRPGRRAGPPAGAAARAARRTRRPASATATSARDQVAEARTSPRSTDIGTALETSSQRVDTMLANERHFTADATHQLRTGHHRHRDAVRDPEHAARARRRRPRPRPGWHRPTSSTPRSTSCWPPPATARPRSGCRSTSTALVNHHAPSGSRASARCAAICR